MTGLDAFSPLSVVFDPGANKICDYPMSEEKLKEYIKTWGSLWTKSTGKSRLPWKPLGPPSEGLLRISAQLWSLTKEITSWLLLVNLKIFPNFTPDGMVLIKSLRLSQIRCLSSIMSSARLRKQCMLLDFNFTWQRPQYNHPSPRRDSTGGVKVYCWNLQGFLKRRERTPSLDSMAYYRRTNGYHVPRCFQAFTSLPGLSRPSSRTHKKVSVSMVWVQQCA